MVSAVSGLSFELRLEVQLPCGRRKKRVGNAILELTSFAGSHRKMYNFGQELCSRDGLSVRAVKILRPVLCKTCL